MINIMRYLPSFLPLFKALVLTISMVVWLILPLSVAHGNTAQSDTVQSDTQRRQGDVEMYRAKANLQDILTSEQYAKAIESEQWVAKPRPQKPNVEADDMNWLRQLLESLFEFDMGDNSGSDFSILELLAVVLKTAFIGALIVFIAWVIARATGMSGWGSKFSFKSHHLSTVSDYEAARLSQGWKSLPAHDHIPVVVNELIQTQDYNQAASILYRGGLRWLAKSHALHIAPATTEMQCVAQMNKINQSTISSHPLTDNTKAYISGVIQAWIEVAYNANPDINVPDKLQQLSSTWLTHLPMLALTTKHDANSTTKNDDSTQNRLNSDKKAV